ncbi:hypothetical protein D3C83_223260 [compost metagenome]
MSAGAAAALRVVEAARNSTQQISAEHRVATRVAIDHFSPVREWDSSESTPDA